MRSNRERWNKYQNDYQKSRRKTDPAYKKRLNANQTKYTRSLAKKKTTFTSYKDRYWNDPKFRIKEKARARAYYHRNA